MRIVDSRNFPVSKTIAAALVEVKPGGMREMHWHPNNDEWQYYLTGTAKMTVLEQAGQLAPLITEQVMLVMFLSGWGITYKILGKRAFGF